MIQAGDLVKINEGVYVGKLALVILKPYDTVARVKILDPIASNEYSTNGYVAYNTDSLEKL
tara:strand:- start:92 stop:274 length:183 start_codon:yes stop_codon:yes gene_type:complete